MPSSPPVATPYELHKGYVLAVLSRRCNWLDPGDREAIFHDAYEVLLEKQLDGQIEPEEMHEREVRAYLTQTALFKALAEGKRAERRMTTVLDEDAAAQPDTESPIEERVAASMDGAPMREIVAELPARQQAIVKLRFYFERSPAEIQQLLGITERTYRRQLERAMRKVSERYDLVLAGRWCESHRTLIVAYVAGLAPPERARLARAHIESCRGCARMAAGLREATRRSAALLPFPVSVESGGAFARASEALTATRDSLADLAFGAARQLASLSGRVDPSVAQYAPVARPGAVAASVATCLAIGGGATYCAVEGVPEPLRALVGATSDASKERRERQPAPEPERTAAPVVPSTPAPVFTAPTIQPPAQAQTEPANPPSKPRAPGPKSSPEPAPGQNPEPESVQTAPAPEFSPEAQAPVSPAPEAGGAAPSQAPAGPQNEFDF